MDFHGAMRLFDAALDSVFQNIWTALRVTLVPLLVFVVLVVGLFHREIFGMGTIDATAKGAFAKLALAFLVGIFLFYLTAVNWHRAILLPKELRVTVPMKETFYYLLKSLGAILSVLFLGLVAILPTSAITGRSVQITVGDFVTAYQQGWLEVALTFTFTWVFWFWYLSVSPSLVRAALGKKEGLFAAYHRSLDHIAISRAAATLMTLCMLVYSVVGAGVPGLPLYVAGAIHIGVLWLVFVVSISLLTQFHELCEPQEIK